MSNKIQQISFTFQQLQSKKREKIILLELFLVTTRLEFNSFSKKYDCRHPDIYSV